MAKLRPDEINLLDLWYVALGSEAGIYIKTDEPRLLMNQLYKARQAEGTAELQDLSIVIPDLPGQVWIVKTAVREQRYA